MAEMLVQSESLTSIADKIRVLSGTEDGMSLSTMENYVDDANADINTEADLIAQIAVALKGKAVEGGDSDPILQDKTVTPTAETQVVSCDSIYDGLKSVTVNGDSNLIPENIAEGVSVFGVTGTHESGTAVQVTEKTTFKIEDSNGNFSVTCGFKPDVVFIDKGQSEDGCKYATAVPFSLYPDGTDISVPLWKPASSSGHVYDFYFRNTSNGFEGQADVWFEDWTVDSVSRGTTFNYIAVKYTA